jgi:hypothetical protein
MRFQLRRTVILGWILACPIVVMAQEKREGDGKSDIGENAALRYWQAYAAMSRVLNKEQIKLIDDNYMEDTTIDDAGIEALNRCKDALAIFRRGTELPYCSWGFDLEYGYRPGLEDYPHVRALTRLACFSARYHFQNGQTDEGLEETFAVIALGRHVGTDDLVAARGVQAAIESCALEVLGIYLPTLNEDQLKNLKRRLDALPPIPGLKATVLQERRMFGRWVEAEAKTLKDDKDIRDFLVKLGLENPDGIVKAVGGTLEGLGKFIEGTREVLDELAALMDRSKDDFSWEYLKFEEKLCSDTEPNKNAFAATYLVMYDGFFWTQARKIVVYAMLQAAIARQLDGPEAFQKIKDPYGDGPFEYRKMEKGYLLVSKAKWMGNGRWALRQGIGRKTWDE